MLPKIRERVVCADGASVSIQAGRHTYCTPRDDYGPYTAIEAGFPTERPPDSWFSYMDGDDADPTQTVYGYMPIVLVAEFINAHGGMVSGELPPFAVSGVTVMRA